MRLALRAARLFDGFSCFGGRHQQTEDFKVQNAARAGVESTHPQAGRRSGLRRSRYLVLRKTRLQHVATAAALASESPASFASPPASPLEGRRDDGDEGRGPLAPFVTDTALTLHLRSFYFDGTQNSGTESEAWAGGGWLSYQSGWLLDAFAIGATMYGSAPLYAPADKDGTLLLGPGQKAYYALGEAWGALRYRDYAVLKGYRQPIDQGARCSSYSQSFSLMRAMASSRFAQMPR